MKLTFFIILLTLFGFVSNAQLSKKHYMPPLTSADEGSATPQDQYFYISTPSNADVPFTIIPVGQTMASQITGLVSRSNPATISLGTGFSQLFIQPSQSSTVVNNKGYIIEADSPIYVSARLNASDGNNQAGALVSKGSSSLGTTFRVGAFTNEEGRTVNSQGATSENLLSFVSVMATEDATTVNFSDISNNTEIDNFSGTFPLDITLNTGESYTIAMNSYSASFPENNKDGLIGALVTSNKNIVVNCGSANGSFSSGNGRDYGIDQIVDVSKTGNEYIFVRGDGSNAWENILIVVHSDNTTISINGNAPIATINAGDYYLIEGENYSANDNMYVETSEDVFAYQGIGATSGSANQGMFFVPPLSCEARGNLDNIAEIENIGSSVYSGGVTIVTKVGATVTINNLPLSNYNTIGPNAVTENTEYETYKVTGLTGNISVESDDELYCAYFNFNGNATSGSFYSGFPSAPEIVFDANFELLGNCIPNVTLTAANTQSFDTFEWFFDDGSGGGFQTTNVMTPDFTPTNPGSYKLIGTVTCSGLVLESVEVPVSICPNDTDNDGIIDNLDIDNDNDGILNCQESNGDVIIDLTTISQPQFVFENGSSNNTLVTGNYTQSNSDGATNSFSGNNNGNFTSIVNAASSAQNDYTLSFSELVNFKFSEDIAINQTITAGEFFVVKITPVNKNITLVDVDDRLLIDSNFDGEFETGITSISGSEIRFQINPAPNGNMRYEFFADKVDGFTFEHNLSNASDASTFNGNISLTCYQRDSDNDGLEDALDLDSDNDGIPDYVEVLGNDFVVLSGVDYDNNGLDDIYNLNASPIDTDEDGVFDYLDLDSDNDGVFDLFETGQLGTLSDTDFNGIVDGNFGNNGWADAAETSADSGEIDYALNDQDNDDNFSYLDLDSDGDDCSDVIEAGFSDGNMDDLLGDATVVVNQFGLVTNASDGYTMPNTDYSTAAPLIITTQPRDTQVCEEADTTISVVSADAENYQWELSTNGITWTILNDDANYSNTNTDQLTISNTPLAFNSNQYRVLLSRNGNSCDLYSDEITLTVNPLPIVNNMVELVQCDDDNDGFSDFNLNEANELISDNAANETFTFYLSESAALIGDETDPEFIAEPTTFENQNVSSGLVFVSVQSQFGCIQVSEVDLQVSTTAIPEDYQRMFFQCDDFLDANGNDNANNDNRDGIATFDFSNVTPEVLTFIPANQNPLPPRYYRNEADALAEVNEIEDISNYRNIGYPGTQEIFIRIDSAIANDCLGLGSHITLTVEELPVANPVTIEAQCDGDNDGQFPFDTSAVEATVLNGQANIIVTYFAEDGTDLPSPLPNPFLTESQIITIRVTNNNTQDPDGPCFDETTLEFTVFESPIANPVVIAPVCDTDDNQTDGFFAFDTSTIQDAILQGQTGFEVSYFTSSGNPLSSPLPNPFFTNTQTITVEVTNPLNDTCTDMTTLNFEVNPLPEFTIETPQIVCSSDPTFTIVLDPIEENPSEVYDYEWIFEDGTLLATTPTLSVSTPGTYTITLIKTDGTGCSRSSDVFVNASELANITLDDITIEDISDNNSITIDNANNNLGLGDYEFALDFEYNFQDEPVFTNVSAGLHTLFVRDKNGCGTSELEVPVIGFPKFFTPNNDGYNDVWALKGITSTYQANSMVTIFNRYGKLMTKFRAFNNSWDGTINGNKLPTSDYWFVIDLEDGRQFSGHFTLKR